MADALSWLQQLLGGGQDAQPAAGGSDALGYLKRYLATSGEALSEAPAGIARGVGDVGQMLYGIAQRQGMAEAGLPPAPESQLSPVGPGARALGGFADFATGGMTHGAVPQGAGYSARQATAIPAMLADESGALRIGGRRGAITLDTPLPAVPELPAEELIAGVGNNRPPPPPKYAQYAEQYPAPGPPTIKINDKGNPYEAKQLTPEAIAFAKERLRISKEMEGTGYEPYFDPAQRSYVDPGNYPPANVDTATIVPKKPTTVEQYAGAIGAPETAAALRLAYDRGIGLGNAEHWYAMAQLEKAYTDELGQKEGRAAFLDEFAVPMSATTSGQNPTANLLMAHHLEYLRKRGEPVPPANQLPSPIGGQYGQNNLDDYMKIRAAGGYPGLGATTPKMHDFTRSMIGDLTNPVMDDQMTSGMLEHAAPALQKGARKTAYGMLQQPVRDFVAELNAATPGLNLLPGNVQDVAWAGFKNEPGKPMISIVNDAVERTHRLTGMPREEIVRRGLVRKEIPLYGLGALGLGMGGLGGLGGLGGGDTQY